MAVIEARLDGRFNLCQRVVSAHSHSIKMKQRSPLFEYTFQRFPSRSDSRGGRATLGNAETANLYVLPLSLSLLKNSRRAVVLTAAWNSLREKEQHVWIAR